MVVSLEIIEENYPLHKLIWEDRPVELDALISSESFSVSVHYQYQFIHFGIRKLIDVELVVKVNINNF